MMKLVLLDPPVEAQGSWQPFGGVRPVSELRAGAHRLRERWERALGLPTEAVVSADCAGFADVDAPPVVREHVVTGPTIVALSQFAPDGAGIALDSPDRCLVNGGQVVACMRTTGTVSPGTLEGAGAATELAGRWIPGVPSLLDATDALLPGDCDAASTQPLPEAAVVLGDPALVRAAPGTVEPGVVFDVRHGAVVVGAGAEVRSGTRLEGPCWVGAGARIVGGFIRQSVIGPRCVVRGEVSSSVFIGYANKAHDGFVGHSVVGHWVNLGALTTTSNLKNTYGEVRLELPDRRVDTGRQFLGSLIADHAKTAIGTMLSTGTLIGAGANVFGADLPPRWIPPFAWGNDGATRMTARGFLDVARRVLPRREVEVTPAVAAWLADLHRRLA